MIANLDAVNAVTARAASAALDLMLAAKEKRPLPGLVATTAVPVEMAKRLDGVYGGWADGRMGGGVGGSTRHLSIQPPVRPSVILEERSGHLFYHKDGGEVWLELKRLADTLIADDRLGFGDRLVTLDDGIVIGRDTLKRVEVPKPQPLAAALRGVIGEYGTDWDVVYLREEGGRLHALIHSFFDYPLTDEGNGAYRLPDRGLYHGERVVITRDQAGRGTMIRLGGVAMPRRAIAPEDGSTFKITPLRPADELVRTALAATPPKESGEFLKPDLVEVVKLDPTIKLDMRYATTNNFVSTAFYKEGRAFLQRPAAEALARANHALRELGYGLLIHDSYRPWYVTKMFWDATPEDKRVFVANPATGSRHNRGCAVDLTLYDLKTGKPIQMVSGYDEFSGRAYPYYPGGTSLQRWHRRLLRKAMEAEGFTVFDAEWWHFDYQDWRKYPILNLRFEEIGG